MFLRSRSLRLVVVLGALALLSPLPTAVAEDEAPEVTVVASGLNNPRGLNFGPDDALYVAEAGKGGNGPCTEGPEGTSCVGLTGAVTRVEDGEQERVVKGLPSHASEDGSFALGPHDVSLRKHLDMYITVGLGGPPELREAFGSKGRLLAHLVRATAGGDVQPVADIAAFEASKNPDGGPIDTNPFGVLKRGGRRIVADAGGNSLLKVDSEGTVTTLAVFPTRSVTFQGQAIDMHAVPTSVTLGPDGDYFVGQLTGFPFPKGGARVYRVPAGGGEPEIYARGFTNVIDVAFDDEGRLIVLEIAHNSLLAKKPHGALLRVEDDGSVTTLYDKLFFPGGVALGEDGSFYVTNCGVCAGTGEVLRIEP